MAHPFENLVNLVIAAMESVPLPLVYLIAMAWAGLEATGVPVPLSPVLLFLGSLAGLGHVNIVLVVAVVTLGCLAGASVAYVIGQRVGTAAAMRYGRHVGLTPTRVQHIDVWLRRWGAPGVFLLRLPPGVRTFAPLVEGEAGIALPWFLLGTLAGALVVSGAYAGVGNILGRNYRAAVAYLDRMTAPGVVVLVVATLIIVGVVVLHRVGAKYAWHQLEQHFHRHRALYAPQAAIAPEQPGSSGAADVQTMG